MTETKHAPTLAERLQEFVGKPYGGPSRRTRPGERPDDPPPHRRARRPQPRLHRRGVREAAPSTAGIVAPATSLQVWTMPGLAPAAVAGRSREPAGQLMGMVDAEGYVGVVATNCEQTYHRYLKPGDLLTVSSEVESIAGPKQTGPRRGLLHHDAADLPRPDGRGRRRDAFPHPQVQARQRDRSEGEPKTEAKPAPELPPPPDRLGLLLGGRRGRTSCASSGARSCGTLRHPPRPMCPKCRSLERDYVVVDRTRRGLQLRRAPPSARFPDASTRSPSSSSSSRRARASSATPSTSIRPTSASVCRSRSRSSTNAQGRKLPQWRPRSTTKRFDEVNVGDELPPLAIELTPTVIVSTAIATRDYQDVHHDRDLAHPEGLEGHLHEHPHDQRVRGPVHHRLTSARRRSSRRSRSASARRTTPTTR